MKMPDRHDYVQLLHEFVCAVDAYGNIDPDWAHIATKQATDARDRMYRAARLVMLSMSGENLADDDIDEVFWTD